MLTDEQLAELEELLAELPDGPWYTSDCEGELQVWPESELLNVTRNENGKITGYRTPPSLMNLLAEWELNTWDSGTDEWDDQRRAVAEFLVLARTAVPALLACVRGLEQQLAEIKRLAYVGGQSANLVRRQILGVFEDERRALVGEGQ